MTTLTGSLVGAILLVLLLDLGLLLAGVLWHVSGRGDRLLELRKATRPMTLLALGALYIALGLLRTASGDRAIGLLDLGFGAVFLYLGFRDPNGRWRRRARKAAGYVRDLGHRLVVSPHPAPTGA